jgi:dynein heavy chain, axonemal
MPKKETFGAQPPIEIIRQFLDHRGWYNRKDLQFMNLEDLVILSAMGPPGGGRTRITDRMVRHFNIIAYTELEESTIKQIFSGLVNFFLKRFSEDIKSVMPTMIDSVLYMYNTVKKNLLPTPTKSHYTFNMRDISKVFQGICNASLKHTSERADIVRLFYHESMRVFHDRLINDEDREYFKNLLVEEFQKYELQKEEVINMDRIIYGDFFQGRDLDIRPYHQTPDMRTLLSKMEAYQEEYNEEAAYSASSK